MLDMSATVIHFWSTSVTTIFH